MLLKVDIAFGVVLTVLLVAAIGLPERDARPEVARPGRRRRAAADARLSARGC